MKDGININDIPNGFSIRIDPIAMHKGLKEQIDKAREEILKLSTPRKPFAELLKKFENRFCDVCFFGKPKVVAYGENLCEECANNMYELDKDNTGPFPVLKRKKSYEWWVRVRRRRVNEALFAAYCELAPYKVKETEK